MSTMFILLTNRGCSEETKDDSCSAYCTKILLEPFRRAEACVLTGAFRVWWDTPEYLEKFDAFYKDVAVNDPWG